MHEGLLVTDVDNTLFDWVGTWACAFDAMLCVLENETGRNRKYWRRLLRNVHVRRKAIECPTALEDLSGDTGFAPSIDRPMVLARAAAARLVRMGLSGIVTRVFGRASSPPAPAVAG